MGLSSMTFNLGSTLTYVFYVLIALLALLVMITIHEFGHFIAGKKLGFKINEFAVGFGKVLLKRTTKDGILVTLRLIPLGGFCSFEGEDENSSVKNAFNNMQPWKRLIVLFNGAFFNFLSAILIFFILLISVGYGDLVQVKSIDSTATNVSELQVNDVIYEVDGVKTDFLYDRYFSSLLKSKEAGQSIELTVKRDGEYKKVNIVNGLKYNTTTESGKTILTLDSGIVEIEKVNDEYIFVDKSSNEQFYKISENDDKYIVFTYNDVGYVFVKNTGEVYSSLLGISIGNYVYSFGEGFVKAVPFTCEWAWKILVLLWQLVTGQLGLDGVGGPITTINAMATYTQANWLNLLILFPLISVNLAVFNLLPFPALDGARMVFVGIEAVRGKPIDRNIEGYIHGAGLILLLGFVVLVDILNLFA